ncbi:hypothetical protein PsorP6_009672 [Peronosclerospora sorghi]|uniref:Uncharacterized protein n=1 Tax=Peronosclerospora sorghi TaxID=230839 RepID=A0ACC0W173_9STRA|nr:hypothetical protein PsorP6_009672 [Peronosclerospora sorghi]
MVEIMSPKPLSGPNARRSNEGGVAMSLEIRPPRELLTRIGINGKEVVKIIKSLGWNIVNPHGLQQDNLYYIPGAKEKEEQGIRVTQNEDFFVGEGELYAFILKQGGLQYLLPDEVVSSPSDGDPTDSVQLNSTEEDDDTEDEEKLLQGSSSDRREWKRRKKLSTRRSHSVDKMSDKVTIKTEKVPKPRRKAPSRVKHPLVKSKQTPSFHSIDIQTEFLEYQKSLTTRGWRAQLLQDIDLHLLRYTAAIDRRQRACAGAVEAKKKSTPLTEDVGPHVVDGVEICHEVEGLSNSIRVAQEDLSSMIESMIVEGEQRAIPDRNDSGARIGIPGFISTGSGSLVLLRDIERYLLLLVAAVRRYQRTKKALCVYKSTKESFPAVNRKELRALQLSIEESNKELQELTAIVAADSTKAYQDIVPICTLEETSRSNLNPPSPRLRQNTSGTTDCDAEASNHDESVSQHSITSSPRLEGAQWFV